MTSQDLTDERGIIGFDSRGKSFDWVLGSEVEVQLECWPGIEAVFTSDNVKSVSKLWLDRCHTEGCKSRVGGCVLCETLPQQRAGFILKMFEVVMLGKFVQWHTHSFF